MHATSLATRFLLSLLCAGQLSAQSASLAPGAPPPAGPGRRIVIGGPDGPPQPFPEAKAIPPPKNDEQLAAAIKKLATDLAAADHFSGSILVAIDGKPVVDGAWGLADRSANTPNDTETAYDIGSIGKLFTQIAVLQLVESGKLALDQPFGKYLPDYPSAEVAGKVTLRQLLVHSSGIPDIFSHVTPETKLEAMVELRDFLPLFAQKPLDFAPGTSNRYSSSGYIVLGLVLEAVTDEKYADCIRHQILDPAGMKHSGFFDRAKLPASVAHSYEGTDDVTGMHPRLGSPAGGLQASTGDLFRLVQALNRGKLLKPESITTLRALIPRPPDAPAPADPTKLMAYGIEGGAPGVSAQLVIDPSGRYTRIILCNGGPPMAMSMGATLREWIAGIGH